MALPSDYISGTITLTNGSTAFTGTGTGWLAADFREGDIIFDVEGGEGAVAVIASITSNTAGVLSKEWEGPTLTGVDYRMRYQWDSGRVSAQSRAAIEMLGNGNLQSFASITGPGVPVFDGPHSVTIKPESDFVNGVAYDVQVDTLADRDAYDGQSEGFAVLVSDVGDGRAAIYSKVSNTSGDWSDPAYITGPVGPLPDVEATVTSLPPGSTATVTEVPITGGVRLDFQLPEASGFYNAGVYDIAEAYNQDDVVRHSGSSFIALQPVPVGEIPSSAFPPVDTPYWQVLAAKGQDGTGTGDVVGPSTVTPGRVAIFSDSTGKLLGEGPELLAQTIASQAEAEAGTENTKRMTALRTAQQVSKLVVRTQIFTSSGTYTPHANMLFATVECVGGGGAGGSVSGVASTNMASSGGGGGAYARRTLPRASFGASQPVTVGPGGSPGAAGNNAGNAGGTSSLGTLCSAGGGDGGGGALNPSNISGPGIGGSATVGDLTLRGSDGGGGAGVFQSAGQAFYSGYGGASLLSGTSVVASGASAGRAGKNFGGGGSGATSADTSSRQGGAGSQGIVIITEFCTA